jgi:hypothetical protein
MNVAAVGLRFPARILPAAWRRIGWREIAWTALLGLAAVAFYTLVDMPSEVIHEPPGPKMVLYFQRTIYSYGIIAFSLLLALVLADDAVDRGAPRVRTYAVAIVAGCVAGIVIVHALGPFVFSTPFWQRPNALWRFGRSVLQSGARCLPIALGAGFLYAEMRRVRRTQALLREAEVARAQRARTAFEARLSAMQARVEPQFLFDTLGRVRDLYDADPIRADAMLDDLIAYLRAAMPRMRESSSTVRQEIELARRYLAIVAPAGAEAGASGIAVADEADAARMPPMVLLPLIDCALHDSAVAGTPLRIDVRRDGGALRVSVAVRGEAFARGTADERMRALRERMAALYGARGRLTLKRRDVEWTEAAVELPFEVPVPESATT